ncbi:MAG: menaquinone biosynthesis protein [Planctomycetota bacterium]
MQPVRLACVSYINTRPLIDGLAKADGVTLITAPPAEIAGLLASGQANLGLISVVDAIRSPEPLALVPAGMIGSDGPTFTVRLFSTTPPEDVRTIHADIESHTSVALCQILIKELSSHKSKTEPEVVPFDAANDKTWPEAVLLIGDKVITAPPPPGQYAYELDLGEAWRKLTGLPFVYGMWACRASDADSSAVAAAAALVDRQLRHNLARLDALAAAAAPEHNWPIETTRTYYSRYLHFSVGEPEREAVKAFFDRLGATEHPAWVDWRPALSR